MTATLAQRLTEAREAKGLSQSALAREINIKPQAIQAIEANKVQQPRNIVAIAKALGVDPDYLLTGVGRGPVPPDVALRSALIAYGVDRHELSRVLALINTFVQTASARSEQNSDQGQSPHASRRPVTQP